MRKVTALLMLMMLPSLQAQETVRYVDGPAQLSGLYYKPVEKRSQANGILILPAWMGIDSHAKDVAQKLSAEGYHVFVADIYGVGHYPKNASEAGKQSSHYKTNYKEYQHRINLALHQLIRSGADPNRIAVIGYCFGGTGAIEAARANLPIRGVVSFHGGLSRDSARPSGRITPKILVCHGAVDPYVPAAEVAAFEQEMKASKADYQFIAYSGAVHSFTDPNAGSDASRGAAYQEAAARRSWEHLRVFLGELFEK